MRKELLIRCDCVQGCNVFAWTTFVADSFGEEEHWIEIIMTYKPHRIRDRIRAFRGRYEEAVVVNQRDIQKLRDFLLATDAGGVGQ